MHLNWIELDPSNTLHISQDGEILQPHAALLKDSNVPALDPPDPSSPTVHPPPRTMGSRRAFPSSDRFFCRCLANDGIALSFSILRPFLSPVYVHTYIHMATTTRASRWKGATDDTHRQPNLYRRVSRSRSERFGPLAQLAQEKEPPTMYADDTSAAITCTGASI